MRRHSRFLATASLVAVLSLAARADVDAEIDTKAKVSSELAEGEVETFRFWAPRGSVLTLTLAAKKKAPLDFVVDIDVDAGEAPNFRDAKKFKDTGTKFQVKGLELTQSASYALTVRSVTGAGEYALKLKVAPKTKWSDVLLIGAGETESLGFAAPPDSAVTLKAKAAKGSAADPRFGDFGGTDLSAEGTAKSGSHTVKTTVPEGGGDVSVDVTNIGATGGDVNVSATVKAPKVKTQKLDVRPAALGEGSGDESILARTIDAGAGGSVVVGDGSGIDGAGVLIDPDALDTDTRISVSSVDQPDGLPGQSQAGGPSVAFGPSGVEFSSPATVTLPYDDGMLAADADPNTDLSVLRVEADGTVTENAVSSVNTGDNTVTTETDGFSTFVVIGPKGTPRIEGNEYWNVFVEFEVVPDQAGMDSRGREVDFGYGIATFGAAGVTNDFAWGSFDNFVDWAHDDNGNVTINGAANGLDVEPGTWDYGSDGRSVEIRYAGEPDVDVFALSKDGRFLASRFADSPGSTGVGLDLLVKKPDVPFASADVPGTFWFAGIDGGLFDDGGNGPICIEYEDGFGTVQFKSNGTVRVDITHFFTDFDGPGGASESFVERNRETGTWRIDEQPGPLLGSLVLQFTDEDGPSTVRVMPGCDGNVMLGIEEGFDPNDAGFSVFVLVRQGSGLKSADLSGDFGMSSLDFGPSTYAVPSLSVVPDFDACVSDGLLQFDGSNSVTLTDIIAREVRRDDSAAGGVFVDQVGPQDEGTITFSLAKNGKVSGQDAAPDDTRFLGALSPDRALMVLTDDPRDRVEFAVLTILFELPPLQGGGTIGPKR